MTLEPGGEQLRLAARPVPAAGGRDRRSARAGRAVTREPAARPRTAARPSSCRDIATDPLWDDWPGREVAAGARDCAPAGRSRFSRRREPCSAPSRSTTVRRARAHPRRSCGSWGSRSHLAGIAIERYRDQVEARRSPPGCSSRCWRRCRWASGWRLGRRAASSSATPAGREIWGGAQLRRQSSGSTSSRLVGRDRTADRARASGPPARAICDGETTLNELVRIQSFDGSAAHDPELRGADPGRGRRDRRGHRRSIRT